ncbi:HNH endonuclease family protein [Roseomonas elaeocarpi]|uniref:Restriction endonuclease n=1 Tax=Roseomonas elaeocarpi TaxID=907779 RepID=A0ABV6JU32_9PROT
MSRRHERRAARSAFEQGADAQASGPPVCPLCDRPIPPDAKSSLHHLTPRLKGGTHRGTVRLHQLCHSAIHARFTETELARDLHEVEALRADPRMVDFLEWVRNKPPAFHAPTRAAKSRTAKWR